MGGTVLGSYYKAYQGSGLRVQGLGFRDVRI